jgi:hypothetical protein
MKSKNYVDDDDDDDAFFFLEIFLMENNARGERHSFEISSPWLHLKWEA